jgi:hypothetical protein
MAMRLRVVDGYSIAVCAALTESKEGDVYLDDEQHYAIAMKFYHEAGHGVGEYAELMEREQNFRDAAKECEEWSVENGGEEIPCPCWTACGGRGVGDAIKKAMNLGWAAARNPSRECMDFNAWFEVVGAQCIAKGWTSDV